MTKNRGGGGGVRINYTSSSKYPQVIGFGRSSASVYNIPSFVRTDVSEEEIVGTTGRGRLGRLGAGTGWLTGRGGLMAGSIFHGDTLSGRGIDEFSSHLTCIKHSFMCKCKSVCANAIQYMHTHEQ